MTLAQRSGKGVLSVLGTRKPKSFILENVPRLLSHRQTWEYMKGCLRRRGYMIDFKLYNTKNFALPQNRSRLYIIGIKTEICKKLGIDPSLPEEPTKQCPPLSSFLDPIKGPPHATPPITAATACRNLKRWRHTCHDRGANFDDTWALDIDASPSFMSTMLERNPTLTYSRPHGFWITSHRRRMTSAELFRLQGFPVGSIRPLRSQMQMGQLAGNSMSVPVLTHVFNYLMPLVKKELTGVMVMKL